MTEAIPISIAYLWKRSNAGVQELGPMLNLTDPATLQALEEAFSDDVAVQYGIMAAFSICIYDFMLTISDEVELFWAKMDYKVTRVLYLVVRTLKMLKCLLSLFLHQAADNVLPNAYGFGLGPCHFD